MLVGNKVVVRKDMPKTTRKSVYNSKLWRAVKGSFFMELTILDKLI